jgi:hypothetical protein
MALALRRDLTAVLAVVAAVRPLLQTQVRSQRLDPEVAVEAVEAMEATGLVALATQVSFVLRTRRALHL